MKFRTLLSAAMVSVASSFAFADQGDVLITFSTPGPDKYADGVQVADGEWYALCWAPDGAFDGLTTDCKPVNAAEELILVAPLAKGGKCPLVAFEFARKAAYENGAFSVMLLDTRDANGKPAAAVNGKPAFLKNAVAAATTTKGAALTADAQATEAAGSAGAVAWVQPELQADLQGKLAAAQIVDFQILDTNIKLTVTKAAGATYVVRSGATVDTMKSFKLAPAADETTDETTTFIVPKKDAKFFSVGTL